MFYLKLVIKKGFKSLHFREVIPNQQNIIYIYYKDDNRVRRRFDKRGIVIQTGFVAFEQKGSGNLCKPFEFSEDDSL